MELGWPQSRQTAKKNLVGMDEALHRCVNRVGVVGGKVVSVCRSKLLWQSSEVVWQ